MSNDECRKRASQASCECMHLAIRASDFVILSSLGISSFVIAYKAWRTWKCQKGAGHSPCWHDHETRIRITSD